MLYIHTSHQLEQLASKFVSIVNSPLDNVFTPELVVVQNRGMARWLSMHQADIASISANTEFLFPAEFMWKLLRLVSSDIPEQSQCNPETLRFHIMAELTNNIKDYPELHHYILFNNSSDSINEKACWDLSAELAQLLDQYLFYRSDWIREWESSNNEAPLNWQARLWQRCVKDKELVHWLALQDQFKSSMTDINDRVLPTRISFFSMSALSPGYLDLLGELAYKTDVHLFVINPCKDIYWGDIRSQKAHSKLDKDEQTYSEVGNPLLASMGKQGREFLNKLLDLPNAEHRIISLDTATNHTLLNQLQSDIYKLKKPQSLKLDDDSICFNACHTAMREVEVLHDQILNALDTDHQLAPADIVVMMPDIEAYAPYIQAVFSTSKQKLPFSISDQNPQNIFQLIEALHKCLMLNDNRFDVESVFEILAYDIVRNRFDLSEAEVEKCRDLTRATNIRWGISDNSRAKDNLPNSEEHTWKYALDRSLLGYALAGSENGEKLFESERNLSLLAYNEIEGKDALVLSNLKRFTDTIFKLNDWKTQKHSLNTWLKNIKSLVQQLFSEESHSDNILQAISELGSFSTLAQFKQKISFDVFKKIVLECLSNISGSEKFLGYGITFCAMVPMRSVPFKLVALMGMNDGEFPRQDKHFSFDLMANKTRQGDRSRRDEDRYLFLESILAARNKLIFSYIGQSVKDNTALPPSILVNELLDTLTIYSGKSVENWIDQHPLQAFSSRYFNDGDKHLFSYVKEYIELQKDKEIPSAVFIREPLMPLDDSYKNIHLDELINFFKSPARTFLKQRFAIQDFDNEITLPIREPFELESFKNRDVRKLIFEGIEEEDNNQRIARAKGLLPYGEIGDEIYQKEVQIVESFTTSLPQIEWQKPEKFSLMFGDFKLYGTLDQVSKDGRTIQQLTKPYAGDYINLLINHLVLNYDSQRTTTFYSPETSFKLITVDDAKEILILLLTYYWQGLNFPLQFFASTSFAMYQDKRLENKTKAEGKWYGNEQYAGGKDKFENWLLHRTLDMTKENLTEEFLDSSKAIFGTLFEHYEDMSVD